ncbi:hypothetical protein HanRHA438_Chr15g0726131 [Helianthus annuus]|nr:hypothetical protein HanIR_Chr15g0776721 [Helianthus annuus]KAJ0846550.1 hypothetical protein HanRHA438_Chr15g0726131 [Helianthus annuus]
MSCASGDPVTRWGLKPGLSGMSLCASHVMGFVRSRLVGVGIWLETTPFGW